MKTACLYVCLSKVLSHCPFLLLSLLGFLCMLPYFPFLSFQTYILHCDIDGTKKDRGKKKAHRERHKNRLSATPQ